MKDGLNKNRIFEVRILNLSRHIRRFEVALMAGELEVEDLRKGYEQALGLAVTLLRSLSKGPAASRALRTAMRQIAELRQLDPGEPKGEIQARLEASLCVLCSSNVAWVDPLRDALERLQEMAEVVHRASKLPARSSGDDYEGVPPVLDPRRSSRPAPRV